MYNMVVTHTECDSLVRQSSVTRDVNDSVKLVVREVKRWRKQNIFICDAAFFIGYAFYYISMCANRNYILIILDKQSST